MQTMNITLPEELANIVRQRVLSGLYSDEQDVIRDAIRKLDAGENEEILEQLKLAHVREMLEISDRQIKNGQVKEYKSTKELFDEITSN